MVTSRPNIQIISLSSQLKLALTDLRDLAAFFETDSKREIEKRAALHAVRQVLGNDKANILYEKNGRPHLEDRSAHISISHSHDKLAILFSFNERHVGVDVELIRDKVLKIKEKFLSPPELQHLQNASVDIYILYWAVKEAVYKAAGKEGLIFSEEILVEPFQFNANGGLVRARVQRADLQKNFTLHYQKAEDYILAYTDNA